jgi:hypothetical protein
MAVTSQACMRKCLKIETGGLEKVAKFKYLATTLMNKNRIREEIIQFRVFCLPVSSIKLKIKICSIIILPAVLCGCG